MGNYSVIWHINNMIRHKIQNAYIHPITGSYNVISHMNQTPKYPHSHSPWHAYKHACATTLTQAQYSIPVGISVNSGIPHGHYPPLPQRHCQPFLIILSQAATLLSDSFMSESPLAQQGTVVCPWNLVGWNCNFPAVIPCVDVHWDEGASVSFCPELTLYGGWDDKLRTD